MTRTRRRRALYQRVPLWFGVPAAAVFLFIIIIPSVQGVALSFTDWNGITDDFVFVGLENFIRIFQDPRAIAALQNTLVLAVTVTIVQNLIGLLLALGVNGKVRSRHILRVVFFTPVVLTPLVAGYIWGYLLSPRGTVNQALEALGLGFLKQTWLGTPASRSPASASRSSGSSPATRWSSTSRASRRSLSRSTKRPCSTVPVRCAASSASPCRSSTAPS